MKFANLYIKARDAVDRALRSLWAADASNESQEAMGKAVREVTRSIFASDESMPIVQCMNTYKSVHSVSEKEAEQLVYPLWDRISPQGEKHFPPFEHQYKSWKTLLTEKYEGHPMSICVTTGTGSGKTECFMIPLVKDLMELSEQLRRPGVKAIFLYPLNALMEDQKERLENLLQGTELTYTVYNGDLPEREPNSSDSTEEAETLRRKIDEARGLLLDENKKPLLDENGNPVYRFPKMVYTRDMVRKNPPDIILTNPTMLEYILLRKKDESLIDPAQKSLRWIAIDETHSYTGAGAAEMAMLLRRVMLAFNVESRDIRFATSSATFGNARTKAEKIKAQADLRKFIAGMTGLEQDQIAVIDGERTGRIPEGEDYEQWKLIYDNDFVSLSTLFPEGTVEEKLKALDDMCERLGDSLAMKVKVHYFFRVPNNGLYVKLDENRDGAFTIYTRNEGIGGEEEIPMLELSRCRSCGEYVAVAKVNPETDEVRLPMGDDSDMFDLEEDSEDSEFKTAVFGLSNSCSDNQIRCESQRSEIVDIQPYFADRREGSRLRKGVYVDGGWQLVANTRYRCPNCGAKQTRSRKGINEEETVMMNEDMKMMRFRVSADFISRVIAPVILDELEKYEPKGDTREVILHDGQQYLSFADSRQMAARSTLNQNLQQERLWFYTTIYQELCLRNAKREEIRNKIKNLKKQRDAASDEGEDEEYDRLNEEIRRLNKSVKEAISWKEVAELFRTKAMPLTRVFCEQFLKKDDSDGEIDRKGEIPAGVMDNYIHSMMVMYLAGHPSSAAAPETMGLFHSVYPKLSKIEVPEAVERFNEVLSDEKLRITKEDWQNLLRYFLDYSVRTMQAVYLKLGEDNPINIKSTNRFMAEKPRRRPAQKPVVVNGQASDSRIVRFLADLVARDKGIKGNNEAQSRYFSEIKDVVDAMWNQLAEGEKSILTHGETWNEEERRHVKDTDKNGTGARRMNLTEMSFKLYDEAWLCDVNSEKEERHTVALRPISYSFKGYAPYLDGITPTLLDENLHEKWDSFPFHKEDGVSYTEKEVEEWAIANRSLLWDNGIWGAEGIFADRLRQIYAFPNLFIQSEHTAQVDKSVARRRQQSFKNHGVNILACSTTMEMGVDLGSLEVVMLSSVPPQPANYKQRAGRSGRNNRVKSACITLCSSDAIGLRTYFDPLTSIINRQVEVPTVDLMSPQVVQRHLNSFLVRYFGVFRGGNVNQKVADYYTHFKIVRHDGYYSIRDPKTNQTVEANMQLGDFKGTPYDDFNKACDEGMTPELKKVMDQLLKDTCFSHSNHNDLLMQSKKDNVRCYEELNEKALDLKIALANAGRNEKYLRLLDMKYLELLNQRLLNFWATNRFTPNANMPVNVLEFDLSTARRKNMFKVSATSNPSYALREAIAQYVPGNSVVVDGVVYVVRGVECSNMYERVKTFKKLYKNTDKAEIADGNSTLPGLIKWNVNEDYALEIVRPVGFMPDLNETTSRLVEGNVFTLVRAQLIGANDWDDEAAQDHLYSMRDNRESGDSKILYYNEGIGYGFAYCTCCGRTVIEREAASESSHPDIPPIDMNPITPSDPEKPAYHKAISGKNWPNICASRKDYTKIHRNVILGDMIQTDYCEIRIRHKNMSAWMSERNSEYNLLITLGISMAQALTEILGKDRQSVDFALTPNGHICIFDTNPGGAGYSNQLRKPHIMEKTIDRAYDILSNAKKKKSKDMLLDKWTLRYLRYIDLDSAIDWIKEDREFAGL